MLSVPDITPGKAYFDIRFSDVPDWYVMGGACMACTHKGPCDRWKVERRWGKDTKLRDVDRKLKCTGCGNRHHNRFVIVGKMGR